MKMTFAKRFLLNPAQLVVGRVYQIGPFKFKITSFKDNGKIYTVLADEV